MQNIYNHIHKSYDPDHEVIQTNHVVAQAFLQKHILNKGAQQVIDLGVGHGTFLSRLYQQDPDLVMTGVDYSSEMIEQARQIVPMHGIVSDIVKLDGKVKTHSYHLALAHFVLAYFSLDELLQLAAKILIPGGHLSLITSTNEQDKNEASVDNVANNFAKSANPITKIMSYLLTGISSRAKIPEDLSDIKTRCKKYGFEIVEQSQHQSQFIMRNPQEAYHTCIEKGWYVHWLDIPGIPKFVLLALARAMCNHYPNYPVVHPITTQNLLLRRQ